MSKFEFADFYDGCQCNFAVNKNLYSQDAAEVLYRAEIGLPEESEIEKDTGYIRWGFGYDDDGEKLNTWWLEDTKRKKGSCPCWVFRLKRKAEVE